jgi:hypothetical protein
VRQRDRFREEQALLATDLQDNESEQMDIEATLDYIAMFVRDASRLRAYGTPEQKQQLQMVPFPEGLSSTA